MSEIKSVVQKRVLAGLGLISVRNLCPRISRSNDEKQAENSKWQTEVDMCLLRNACNSYDAVRITVGFRKRGEVSVVYRVCHVVVVK